MPTEHSKFRVMNRDTRLKTKILFRYLLTKLLRSVRGKRSHPSQGARLATI
jgi:hypothetical protein